jgi:hypothetical protein
MRLKKHGPRQALSNGQHRGIEAFKVAWLDDAARSFRTGDKVVGLGEICRQWFFYEQVDAGVEQLSGDRVMMDRGHGDAGGLKIEIGGEQLADGSKDRNLVLCRGFLGASRIGLDGGNQRYAFIGRFQFAVDAEMIAAECACARNCNAQLASAGYFAASFSCEASGDFPWTALRQRP